MQQNLFICIDTPCIIDGKTSDAIEMKSKPVNGDVQKILKEANNLRRPFDSGIFNLLKAFCFFF